MIAKKSIRFPSPFNPPELVINPEISIINPIPPTNPLILMRDFLLISSSFIFIKSEVNMALMTKATNKEENNTTDKVMGK